MKKIIVIITLLIFTNILFTNNIFAVDNKEKGNEYDDKRDMFYKSDELDKVVEKYLEQDPIRLSSYANITGYSTVFYDPKVYFIKPKDINNKNEKIEIKDLSIVIPVFFLNEEGETLVAVEHWYNGFPACVFRQSNYYEDEESNSIFDFYTTKNEYCEYVKSKLGEDTIVGTCILQVQASVRGWHETKIKTETNKGTYMYSSVSKAKIQDAFSKNFSNNEIYPLEEYNERIYPIVQPKTKDPIIEFNEDGTIKWEEVVFGGWTGENDIIENNKIFSSKYFWLSIAIVLIATGSVTIFYYRKKQQKSSDTRE